MLAYARDALSSERYAHEAAGHDVVWVRTAAPGASDRDVLAWVGRKERILLTLDKDCGELARGWVLGVHRAQSVQLIPAGRIVPYTTAN